METTVLEVARGICTRPDEWLLRRWNWKSAIFSPGTRALVFFFTNLTAGWRAAMGAMLAELLYRVLTAGFYGAITQAFRRAEPVWAANLTVMLVLPILQHSIEFAIHYTRGTPNLKTSIIASMCFTAVSTLFNLYAMRRGVFVVGDGCGSVGSDLRRLPRILAEFVAAGPIAVFNILGKGAGTLPPGAGQKTASLIHKLETCGDG